MASLRGFPDLELHGQHRHPRPGNRVDVLHPLDFGQHLLGGQRDQMFHFRARRAGKGDEDVGKGHIDLGLFLTRRDQHREQAQQQPYQGQQRA